MRTLLDTIMQGVKIMTINATQARKYFYQLIQDVNENSTPITITNSNGKNAVLMSEEDYEAIAEILHLHSNSCLTDTILESDSEPLEDREVYDSNEEW